MDSSFDAAGADSGALGTTRACELLVGLSRQQATGLLEVTDGRKRWQFWLTEGALSFSKSNLRSEQIKAVKAAAPEADNRQLIQLQATLRTVNATQCAEGEWSWTPNTAPEKTRRADLLEACWAAMQRRLPVDRVSAELADKFHAFPRRVETGPLHLDDLPLAPDAKALLSDLDGHRSLRDVLDFAPLEEADAHLAIVLGLWTGVLDAGDDRSETSSVAAIGFDAADEGDIDVELRGDYDDELDMEIDFGDEDDEDDPTEDTNLDEVFGKDDLGSGYEVKTSAGPTRDTASDAMKDVAVRGLIVLKERLEAAENDFEVLGVDHDASDDIYRKAWFELARDLHPDRWIEYDDEIRGIAGDVFARASQAWENLGDPSKRQKTIDKVIHGKKTEEEEAMEQVQAILAAEREFEVAKRDLFQGRVAKAHEVFQNCVEVSPDFHEFRAYLGYTLFKQNHGKDPVKAEQGREMIRSATENAKKFPDGWVLMGMSFKDEGEPERARRAFINALKQDPTHQLATQQMKRLERKKQADKKAEQGFFKSLFGKKKK